jgi:hypothetical protein
MEADFTGLLSSALTVSKMTPIIMHKGKSIETENKVKHLENETGI